MARANDTNSSLVNLPEANRSRSAAIDTPLGFSNNFVSAESLPPIASRASVARSSSVADSAARNTAS